MPQTSEPSAGASNDRDLKLALRHAEAGRLAEAQRLCRQILARASGQSDALHLLGILSAQSGDLDGGIELIVQCIKFRPDWAEAHYNLGVALYLRGMIDQAISAYRRALEIQPVYPEAMNDLGVCLAARGETEAAMLLYRDAICFRPVYAEAHNNLANILKNLGRLDEAIASYVLALGYNPNFALAHNNLGVALLDRGRLDESLDAFRAALNIDPDYAEALNNLGNLLVERGQLDEAERVLGRAISLKPKLAEAHNNLGNALKAAGKISDAIESYRRAVKFQPENSCFHSNLVYAELFQPESGCAQIRQSLADWNYRHGKRLMPPVANFKNIPRSDRPLRIGYISPDFRDHVIGRNILPLLRHHDRRQFQLYCYARLNRRDELTHGFAACCDHWCDITGIGDEKVARMIAEDEIDILVDLAMHLSDNVLPILARKPAPVQITFAAYPGSTGLSAIDYRLTDPYLDVPGQTDGDYSEKSIYLPETFWCYDPHIDGGGAEDMAVSPLPALANGYITFGCLCDFCKVNSKTLELWARVLNRVAGSCLLMLAPMGESRNRILENMRTFGIDSDRLLFTARQPRREYLRTYSQIDICLDTLPYNGHTTSLDAMWMGVPVITRIGETVVGRAGWSQLSNLGLTEFAGRTDEEFVNIAVNLAGDFAKLAELRAHLRPRMQRSPLMDAERFARNIEEAYRTAWRQWRQTSEQSHDHVEVHVDVAIHRPIEKAVQ